MWTLGTSKTCLQLSGVMWWLFNPGYDSHRLPCASQRGKLLPRKHLLQRFEKWGCFISTCFVFLTLLTNTKNITLQHYAGYKILHSWGMQKPQTENQSHLKTHFALQLITQCELLAGCAWWFQRNELTTWHSSSLDMNCLQRRYAKKCWRMKNNGGMLEVAVSARVVNCVSVCGQYIIDASQTVLIKIKNKKSLSSHK